MTFVSFSIDVSRLFNKLFAQKGYDICAIDYSSVMLEDSGMIEVKQGPYSGRNSDKKCFED